MESLQSVMLGIIQGLTEFLPVSSSGHLVLLQNLFGITEPELLFDISLHVGSLMAIFIVFYQEIRNILQALLHLPALIKSSGNFKSLFADNEEIRISALILVGSIPTAILGILFHKIVDQIFGSVWIVGVMLLVTGTLLWFTRQMSVEGRPLIKVSIRDVLIIGLMQGIAIMPGISRSGSTISIALFLGINREIAGRYSFLLSIPAILGAMILGLDSTIIQTNIPVKIILLGTLTAGIVGYIALKILLRLVKQGRLYYFAPYCWLLGAATLIWSLYRL
ncbi:MAG: undecaprenyl-diphosphate phosphatase [Proteobacteria bacterium]|nr:undecaprenyl-diphosphate phosphatase [Desulfobacteraceae bacterium]MBU3981230.1 undecaprenyl-diphosphate phosphatase [Pseudomonadota bacterium]MBU4011934.1 undecaprenyl-diphosphate phosphatase [Pseudomonadota bacterium]MBU4067862.1 undecaprenyl-diphosphate phosphatase [Pseudomonadota bacterium]MBU4102047.1 undecaprenyl-diphosphate phosphatase [Pseudomonadota bacterium]